PIIKDKLFIFGDWEGSFEGLGKSGLFTVATPEQRRGDFSSFGTPIFDPATGSPDGRGRTPFPNNVIPLNRQSAPAWKLQQLVPLPNLSGVQTNFTNSAVQSLQRNNADAKVTWNRTPTHTIWGKYSAMTALVKGQFSLGAAGGPCLCDGGNGEGSTL